MRADPGGGADVAQPAPRSAADVVAAADAAAAVVACVLATGVVGAGDDDDDGVGDAGDVGSDVAIAECRAADADACWMAAVVAVADAAAPTTTTTLTSVRNHCDLHHMTTIAHTHMFVRDTLTRRHSK